MRHVGLAPGSPTSGGRPGRAKLAAKRKTRPPRRPDEQVRSALRAAGACKAGCQTQDPAAAPACRAGALSVAGAPPHRANVRFAGNAFDGAARTTSKTAEIADGGQRGKIHEAIFVSRLVSGPLARYLVAAAKGLVFRYGGLRLGPVHVGAVSLVGVQAASDNRLAVTLGLREVSVGVHLPKTWVADKGPTWARMVLALLAGKQTLKLHGTLPLRFLVRFPPGGRPTLSLGPLSTGLLKKALGLAFLADAANTMVALLSGKLYAELNRALQGARRLARHVDRIYRQIQQRLGRMAALLPPLPRAISPQRVAACLSLRLSHLTTSAKTKVVRFHLSARMKGYALGGRRCDDPRAIRPLEVGGPNALRRLLLGPPALEQVPDGPAVVIAHDLINAYLATIWASGGLSRVPIRLPALKQNGFDVRHLSYRLPPVMTTHRERLRLEVPELWVYLQTLGEAGRLFATHLRTALSVQVHPKGRIRFVVPRERPPEIWVRCLKEAGGACAAQSRRFQSLVNVGMELAFSPELASPELALEAALPPLHGPGMDISLGRVRPIPRGVMVHLKIK